MMDEVQSQAQAIGAMGESGHKLEESINHIIVAMADIKDNTHEMLAATQNSTPNMNESIKVVNESSEMIYDIYIQLLEFQDKIHKIGEIVDFVKKVASQSNLLALNASIESARAGEAGKGFAVVADQIRNLAEESRKETENIAKILEELSDGTNAASDAVTQSVEAAQVQNDMIQNASESFSGMSGNMSKMIENIEHMDSMLNSLKQANDRSVENIMQISATAEEVTAASTQAENLSNQNLETAENAQQLITGVLSVSEKLNIYQAQE